MKQGDMGIPDVQALVAFGKLGLELVASRMLSLCALTGVVAISAYSVYSASWQGAACTGIVAICFVWAVKSEARPHEQEE